MFRFHINKYSKYPVHEQIKEQIKIAISLGHIGPGYALPSIRDVEEEFNVGRMIVYRAYRELASNQILDLQSRRGALVSRRLTTSEQNHAMKRCERLALRIEKETRKANLLGSAFATYLYHRAHVQEELQPVFAYVESIKTEALDCATQISRSWQTHVIGLTCDEFDNLTRSNNNYRWVLTPFYELDTVSRIAKKLKVNVAPLILKFAKPFVNELQSLIQQGRVLVLFHQHDLERHGVNLMKEITSQLPSQHLSRLECEPFRNTKALLSVAKTRKYRRVYVGNRIWDILSPKVKTLPIISRPQIELDENSLELAKRKIGMIP